MKNMNLNSVATVIDARASEEIQRLVEQQPAPEMTAEQIYVNETTYTSYCCEVEYPKECRKNGTLEEFIKKNALPASELGDCGKICWDLFRSVHPEWGAEEMNSKGNSVGAYRCLPTVDECEGGTLLFVSEEQYAMLGQTPIIAIADYCLNGYGESRDWCYRLGAIDYIVVVVPKALAQHA